MFKKLLLSSGWLATCLLIGCQPTPTQYQRTLPTREEVLSGQQNLCHGCYLVQCSDLLYENNRTFVACDTQPEQGYALMKLEPDSEHPPLCTKTPVSTTCG